MDLPKIYRSNNRAHRWLFKGLKPNLSIVPSGMIPKAITAPIQWWAKHPWMVFCCMMLLNQILIYLSRIPLLTGTLLFDFFLLLSRTVLILSFILGMFLHWQRSKIVTILMVMFIAAGLAIIMPQISVRRRIGYDAEVRNNVKNAARAQEVYFADNGTYTDSIGRLKQYGFKLRRVHKPLLDEEICQRVGLCQANQTSNVAIAVEATSTTYVITGTMTKGCKANTGTWYITSTTGAIDGTRCR